MLNHHTGTTTESTIWSPPPHKPGLERHQVHLWRASLNRPPEDSRQPQLILSAAELDRASRFHFDRDRQHFIAAHTALRIILSRYLSVRPEQLQFRTGEYGKPALAHPQTSLEFNLSHTRDLLVVAITAARAVGVDLEQVRPLDDFEAIAARTFSVSENKALQSVPRARRLESFFRCWTRKEAYIKALGQGLHYPLDQFDVTLRPHEPAALINVANDPGAAARWSMHAFIPAPGYVAALVVDGHPSELKYWRL